ncbi:MAG: hypothetical protein COW01_06890 [Bdellovibrionales bacterium CG12_big_fil_rev_8_21_14_0_65_38_15]|nr:MAG: hypothetical protein COW79_13570 [Bdellovibrionales bacterium CG22_combo_CG10-13_8_21_14_all_38_13]PIQ55694.1 MAG: hypothetical protein COW01_06890 [Bdellovibrionales bacterium CG12_big_fil_rev_8_21_14_0_65_38_15]PIR30704.1 MAG: hypothetical protein COV38_04200 [Bdellovibrionales bacterium CG11_big_fil_rev_8_21_14_0_20_38_13]
MIQSWQEFKTLHDQFALGHLDTETPCPLTQNLSHEANNDPAKAWQSIFSVDFQMLEKLNEYSVKIETLSKDVKATLDQGGRIFLAGCGATGRLSLSLEAIWRFLNKNDQVISFMAGGDSALIRAIERFEDYPDLGARQLKELGFTNKDLLIASSEGGETPFVIGAAIEAANIGGKSWFNYCNPNSQLMLLKRCETILKDKRIQKISFVLGPQALSGSTRMQASTALMLVGGLALFFNEDSKSALKEITSKLANDLKQLNLNEWASLSKKEAALIDANQCVSYITPDDFGICVLTDTTERGPTFSMTPFEHVDEPLDKPALNYMAVESATDTSDAFFKILGHKPRTLDWPELDGRANDARLNGFELTKARISSRKIKSILAVLTCADDGFSLEIDGEIANATSTDDHLLYKHLLLKMILNTHSTVLMGRLGRYEDNVMTWVRPSNLKLIDRTLRYSAYLLSRRNIKVDQNALGEKLFLMLPKAQLDEPIVMRLVQSFSSDVR